MLEALTSNVHQKLSVTVEIAVSDLIMKDANKSLDKQNVKVSGLGEKLPASRQIPPSLQKMQ
jgi:hypothetical protein